MALIRCPKHGIPYNDDNPRGCPACSQEKEGGDASVMRELARVSQVRPEEPAAPAPPPPPSKQEPPTRQETLKELFDGTAATIREQPREIETTTVKVRSLWEKLGDGKIIKFGIPAAVLLAAWVWFSGRPQFEPMQSPQRMETTLPFPVEPGTAVPILFSVLGTQPPNEHPSDRRLERFLYGTNLTVDALNGAVYSFSLGVANRSWQGLTTGLTEDEVRGTLARLGDPEDLPAGPITAPQSKGDYLTYRTLEDRPVRRIRAELRPPNGCYDVIVEMRYQALGVLLDGGDRSIVVGRGDQVPRWASSLITVVDRTVRGSGGEDPAC